MEIKKLLEEVADPRMKEVLMTFLSGWMDRINREQEKKDPQKYQLAGERLQSWEEMVRKDYPELEERNREFLDWQAGYYGEELENYYMQGLCDGIRVFQWMIRL